ncbi:MAG: type II secretion system protein [Acidobacteria bacterium]|nr:type II secretion system protein [Acidobacteriota bacterium]
MSLVEATIILMVLALLTAVLAPAINQYVDDAREAKAKEDVEAIGVAIARLLRDTGNPFLLVVKSGAGNQFTKPFRVDLLLSNGNKPTAGANVNTATTNTSNIVGSSLPLGWSSDLNGNTIASMYDHLVMNEGLSDADDGYRHPADALDTADPSVPQSLGAFGHGWRGAYVNGIPGPDPWGYRYMVNSVYLGAATDATTSGEGRAGTGWSFDTFVVSAGRNNTAETDFESTNLKGTSLATGGSVGNDDLIYVISGFGK